MGTPVQNKWAALAREFVADIRGEPHQPYRTFAAEWRSWFGPAATSSPTSISSTARRHPYPLSLPLTPFKTCVRTMRARGASPDVATRLSAVCAAAGLREVDQHGYFSNAAAYPAAALGFLRATTMSIRAAIIETGTAEVDALNQELEEAEKLRYDVLVTGAAMELVAQVPEKNG